MKFCGGCNCQIDRSRLVDGIKKKLPPGDRLTTDTGAVPVEAGLLLCGCFTACADKPELSGLARKWIRVAGKSVDQREWPEDRLEEVVLKKIEEIKNRK